MWEVLKNVQFSVRPALLIMTGLPGSGVSSTHKVIMENAKTLVADSSISNSMPEEYMKSTFTHSQAIVSRLEKQMSDVTYAKVSFTNTYIQVIVAGLFEHYCTYDGEVSEFMFEKDFEKNISSLTAKSLEQVIQSLNKRKALSASPSAALPFECSLYNGLGLVNIWDFTLDKAVYTFMNSFSGHFSNSYMWLFMDLWRDHKMMHLHPDCPSDIPGSADMVWRSRLHYLLRLCKMCQTLYCDKNSQICKAFAMHVENESDPEIVEACASITDICKGGLSIVGVDDVFDGTVNGVSLLNHFKFVNHFKSFLQYDPPKEVPLWWFFLRILMNSNLADGIFLTRGKLEDLATQHGFVKDRSFVNEFCKFFTSFGSIFDVHLVNGASKLIIAQPSKFLTTLSNFYYGEVSKDLWIRKYGIVSDREITKLVKGTGTDFIQALVEIGLAMKVESSQANWLLDDNDGPPVYYMPSIRDGEPEVKFKNKGAVQLVLDVKSPLVNIEAALIKKLLDSTECSVKLKLCDTVNITQLIVNGCNVTLTSQGDALEIHLDPPDDNYNLVPICTEIVKHVQDIAASKPGLRYHYGVVCAKDGLKEHAYNIYHRRHNLPTTYFCFECMERGYYKRRFVYAWNSALKKVNYTYTCHLNLILHFRMNYIKISSSQMVNTAI